MASAAKLVFSVWSAIKRAQGYKGDQHHDRVQVDLATHDERLDHMGVQLVNEDKENYHEQSMIGGDGQGYQRRQEGRHYLADIRYEFQKPRAL